MEYEFRYTVYGCWPFPTAMLREEDTPAEDSDLQKIHVLSDKQPPENEAYLGDVEISFLTNTLPNVLGWNEFEWIVSHIHTFTTFPRPIAPDPLRMVQEWELRKKREGATAQKLPETIDLTPTWTAIMPVLIAALRDGTATGREHATTELMRAARMLDKLAAEAKKAPEPA